MARCITEPIRFVADSISNIRYREVFTVALAAPITGRISTTYQVMNRPLGQDYHIQPDSLINFKGGCKGKRLSKHTFRDGIRTRVFILLEINPDMDVREAYKLAEFDELEYYHRQLKGIDRRAYKDNKLDLDVDMTGYE